MNGNRADREHTLDGDPDGVIHGLALDRVTAVLLN
jgi:hypothetical protein